MSVSVSQVMALAAEVADAKVAHAEAVAKFASDHRAEFALVQEAAAAWVEKKKALLAAVEALAAQGKAEEA